MHAEADDAGVPEHVWNEILQFSLTKEEQKQFRIGCKSLHYVGVHTRYKESL